MQSTTINAPETMPRRRGIYYSRRYEGKQFPESVGGAASDLEARKGRDFVAFPPLGIIVPKHELLKSGFSGEQIQLVPVENGEESQTYDASDNDVYQVCLKRNPLRISGNSWSNEAVPFPHVARFNWSWSGHGATEHWFDPTAVLLRVDLEYTSGSGLTADVSAVVAYHRHVEVKSFRDYGPHSMPAEAPKAGQVMAGFANNVNVLGRPHPWGDWTGFAMSVNAIGDNLEAIIDMELGLRPPAPTTCRHLSAQAPTIFAADPKDLPRYLCTHCRFVRGLRIEEFVGRNRADVCPYVRRLAKSFVERSDAFPEGFAWGSDNLLSSAKRMEDDGYAAYEVTFVRKRDGFVRRAVVLIDLASKEAWLYGTKPGQGFVPRTLAAFRAKFGEGRQIRGVHGVQPAASSRSSDGPILLTSEALTECIATAEQNPVWQSPDGTVAVLTAHHAAFSEYTDRFALSNGEVAGLSVRPVAGEPFTYHPPAGSGFAPYSVAAGDELTGGPVTVSPKLFWRHGDRSYWLLCCGPVWRSELSIREGGTERCRVPRGFALLRVND